MVLNNKSNITYKTDDLTASMTYYPAIPGSSSSTRSSSSNVSCSSRGSAGSDNSRSVRSSGGSPRRREDRLYSWRMDAGASRHEDRPWAVTACTSQTITTINPPANYIEVDNEEQTSIIPRGKQSPPKRPEPELAPDDEDGELQHPPPPGTANCIAVRTVPTVSSMTMPISSSSVVSSSISSLPPPSLNEQKQLVRRRKKHPWLNDSSSPDAGASAPRTGGSRSARITPGRRSRETWRSLLKGGVRQQHPFDECMTSIIEEEQEHDVENDDNGIDHDLASLGEVSRGRAPSIRSSTRSRSNSPEPPSVFRTSTTSNGGLSIETTTSSASGTNGSAASSQNYDVVKRGMELASSLRHGSLSRNINSNRRSYHNNMSTTLAGARRFKGYYQRQSQRHMSLANQIRRRSAGGPSPQQQQQQRRHRPMHHHQASSMSSSPLAAPITQEPTPQPNTTRINVSPVASPKVLEENGTTSRRPSERLKSLSSDLWKLVQEDKSKNNSFESDKSEEIETSKSYMPYNLAEEEEEPGQINSKMQTIHKRATSSSVNKSPLLRDLEDRISRVYQGDHVVVEAYGTKGTNVVAPVNPRKDRMQREMNSRAMLRMQLIMVLKEKFSNHVGSSFDTAEQEETEACSVGSDNDINEEKEEAKEEEEQDDDEGDDVSVLSMGEQSVATVQSLIVAATILNQHRIQQQDCDGEGDGEYYEEEEYADDDDEWDEYTVESRASFFLSGQQQQSPLLDLGSFNNRNCSLLQQNARSEEEEDEIWEEYTVQSSGVGSIAQPIDLVPLTDSLTCQQQQNIDQDDEYEEETVWEEYTVDDTVYTNRVLKEAQIAHAAEEKEEENDDDDYTEYTVETTRSQHIAKLKSSFPAGPLTKPVAKEPKAPTTDSLKIDNSNGSSKTLETVASSVTRNGDSCEDQVNLAETAKQDQIIIDDDDQYTEVETVADALLALPGALLGFQSGRPSRTEAADVEDDYEEETVLEEYDEEEVEDEDDYEEMTYWEDWDDQTIQTVADAFVSLPRNIQLEFLRSASKVSRDLDDSSTSSKPFEDDGKIIFEENKPAAHNVKQSDAVRTAATESTSGSHGSKFHTPVKKVAGASASNNSGSETWHDARSRASVASASINSAADSRGQSVESVLAPQASPTTDSLHQDLSSPDACVIEAALLDLSRKATDEAWYRDHVVKFGGVLAIVRAMERNIMNSDIQVAACQVLQNVAVSPENQLAICDVGGAEAVISALSNHINIPRVAEVACGCLLVLTSHASENIEVAVVDVIVSSMKHHASHPQIQEKAFRALARLCLDDREKLIALSQVGGFVAMSASLSTHWENPVVKGEAISTLSQLFGRLAQYQAEGVC